MNKFKNGDLIHLKREVWPAGTKKMIRKVGVIISRNSEMDWPGNADGSQVKFYDVLMNGKIQFFEDDNMEIAQ